MSKEDLIRKIASRKFWALLTGVVVSWMVLFEVDQLTIEKVIALLGANGVLVGYMFAEALVDKNR